MLQLQPRGFTTHRSAVYINTCRGRNREEGGGAGMRATALMRALPRGPQSATQGDQSVVYNPINPLIRPQSKVKPHLSYLECGPVFLTDLGKKQNPESSR